MKPKITKTGILILIGISISIVLKAQESTISLSPSLPTSPQAEAINRYGEYNVNYSTGIPDISIPLYEINHRGYKIPLTLKYYPQPLKPGYNYDVFGHGWGLSVNSCISRTIEFAPDEWYNFKINTEKFREYDYNRYFTPDKALDFNFAHDKFNAVLPDGSTFYFVIDNTYGTINYYVSDGRSLKISCDVNSIHDGSGNITSFTVIDENGIKYTFADGDTPYQKNGARHKFSDNNISWNISRIDLPNSNEPITFRYDYEIESAVNTRYEDAAFLISHLLEPPVIISPLDPERSPKNEVTLINSQNYPAYNYKMKLLSSINYGNSSIKLLYKDKQTSTTFNYVDHIQIIDNSSQRDIYLDLEITNNIYFHNTSPYFQLAKLKSATIKGRNPSDTPLVYRFTYKPMWTGFDGTDHWGYANNVSVQHNVANLNLFVEFDFKSILNYTKISFLPKNSLENYCPYDKIKLSYWDSTMTVGHISSLRSPLQPDSHGVLSSIKYPTGGRTEFEFENHQFFTSTDYNGDYIHDKKRRIQASGGGFRIKSITNYASNGVVSDIKNFRYGQTNAEASKTNDMFITVSHPSQIPNLPTGLGEPVVDPNILTYMSYNSHYSMSYPIHYMVLGLDPSGQRNYFNNPFRDDEINFLEGFEWECVFSASNFRRLLNGRPAVLYSEVTVYYGDVADDYNRLKNTSGKTVYKYDIIECDPPKNECSIIESPQYFDKHLSYISSRHRYNKLIEKIDYEFNGTEYKIVKTEKNKWNYVAENRFYDYFYTYPYKYKSNVDVIEILDLPISEFFTSEKLDRIATFLLESKDVKVYDYSIMPPEMGAGTAFTESYLYNERRQLIGKTINNYSASKSFSESYLYPGNSGGTTSPAIQKMVDKNIISPIIGKTTTYGSSKSGYKIEYKEFNPENSSIFVPAELYDMETNGSTSEYVLNSKVISYTLHGNPQEVVTKDGIHTIYLWSYGYQFLIAEIKNATYDQVQAALKAQNKTIEGLYSDKSPVIDDKLLRSNANLSDAHVTTYKHMPGVGIVTMTDPRGFTTNYDYDGFGRLIEKYITGSGGEKQIIESYEYNYQNPQTN